MEYYENVGGASARLYWTPPGGAKEIIPATQLYLPGTNTPPALAFLSDQTVVAESLLAFTVSATDPEAPPQTLTYLLDADAPPGASVTTNGLFTWRPGALQADRTYLVTLRVVDNGTPSLHDAQTFAVTVLPATNQPPSLAPVADAVVNAGSTLLLTNIASDPDPLPQDLRFLLLRAPAGASLNPTNGLLSWPPSLALAGSTNLFTVVVTEAGWTRLLTPVADTFVNVGTGASYNYGNATVLTVKNYGATSAGTRESYLRFDLAGVPDSISNAALRLTIKTSGVPGVHALALVTNDTWGELTLAWTNKPASGDPFLTWTPTTNVPAVLELPVSSAVSAEARGNHLLSLRLWATNQTANGYVDYASREDAAPASRPQLSVVATNWSYLSATQSFRVIVPALPHPPDSVVLTNPTNGALLTNALTLAATASDPDDNLARVEFYADGLKVGESSAAPYTAPWAQPALGPHTLWAVAVDAGGLSATSAVARVAVGVATRATLVATGAVWRYLDNGTDQGAAWRSNNFNDTTWKSGPAQLGYGDGDEATLVSYGTNANNKYVTTYFRRHFLVPDTNRVLSLTARLLRDDGAVVYLNGAEVWRDNLPAGTITFATFATSTISGAGETNFLTNAISPAGLLNGTNLLAVEIHQDRTNSTDLGFDFELYATALLQAQPALRPAPSGGFLNLTAPREAGFFQLFSTTNVSPPTNWGRATNLPFLSNDQWNIVAPLTTNGARFYRLQAQ